MNEQAIAIYCFIDDFFKTIGRKTHPHCKMNDAEILTTALMSARYFYGNLASAMLYMKQHQGMAMIDKSGFIRRLHGLPVDFYIHAGSFVDITAFQSMNLDLPEGSKL